ncbi:hypothetical protein D3C80_1103630 [compost metagenome]
MGRWQTSGIIGIEALHRLHQVETCPQNALVGTIANQSGMGHSGTGQRLEQTCFAGNGFAADFAQFRRRPTQHKVTLPPAKVQQQILRASRQAPGRLDGSAFQAHRVHPLRQTLKVYQWLPVAHGSSSLRLANTSAYFSRARAAAVGR